MALKQDLQRMTAQSSPLEAPLSNFSLILQAERVLLIQATLQLSVFDDVGRTDVVLDDDNGKGLIFEGTYEVLLYEVREIHMNSLITYPSDANKSQWISPEMRILVT